MTTKTQTQPQRKLWHWPPRRILVPLDSSPASLVGWRHAGDFARPFRAEIEGFYVQPWNLDFAGYPVVEGWMAEAIAQSEAKRLSEALSGAVVHHAEGPVDLIIAAQARRGYDLIAMATHNTGIVRWLTGSIAEAVVRRAPMPVLAARGKPRAIRRVLAPVNFEPYARDAFVLAAETAVAFAARLEVLHVAAEGLGKTSRVKAPERLLEDWIAGLPRELRAACEPKATLTFGSPADQIVLASKDADLVVLAAHSRGLLADTVLGTTAERVLRYCPAAVLAVPSRHSCAAQ